jgi:hypothetical protein
LEPVVVRATLKVIVTMRDGVDPLMVAERLFDQLVSDPDDVFPEITEVEDYDAGTE